MLEVLEAIIFLTDDTETKEICKRTAGLFHQYLEHLNAKKAEFQEKSRLLMEEELAREGFRGSALAGLNFSGSEQWQKTLTQLKKEYDAIIKDFKEAILKR